MALPANLSQLTTALQGTLAFANSAAQSGEMYIKMGKDGRWTMGADELELEEGSEWAINPMSFATGWSLTCHRSRALGLLRLAWLSSAFLVKTQEPKASKASAARAVFLLSRIY